MSAAWSYKGFKAFQPLNTYWAEHGLMLHSEFRDGNVPAGHEQMRVLQEALAALPEGVEKVRLRSDTAGYQRELLSYCAGGKDERFGVIEFAIGADVTAEFKAAVRAVPESEWKPLPRVRRPARATVPKTHYLMTSSALCYHSDMGSNHADKLLRLGELIDGHRSTARSARCKPCSSSSDSMASTSWMITSPSSNVTIPATCGRSTPRTVGSCMASDAKSRTPDTASAAMASLRRVVLTTTNRPEISGSRRGSANRARKSTTGSNSPW